MQQSHNTSRLGSFSKKEGDFQPTVLKSNSLRQWPHVHLYWLNSCITDEQSKTGLVCLGLLWWHNHIHA